MGNTEAVLKKIPAQNLALALLYDSINDTNPNPATKQNRLGKLIRDALVAARPGKDSAASLDNMAWGTSLYVYQECKNLVFFKKSEYSTPFFKQLAGIMLTEGLKGVAHVAVTYVMKDPKYGKIAADMTGSWLSKSGQAYVDRLTALFEPGTVRDPYTWASRKGDRDKITQIKKLTLELEGVRIQNGIESEKLNAKVIAFQMLQLQDKEALYAASKGVANQQGAVDAQGNLLHSLSQEGIDQKKQANKQIWMVVGVVGLLVVAVGGAAWLTKSSAQA
jgi:hypothetical protein